MANIRFIISLFGNRHANMLLPLLFSIEKSNPGAKTSIYWEDINEDTIDLLRSAFPQSQWTQTDFHFSTDITRRISSKTLVWEKAAHDFKWSDEWLAFIDADTLVIKDIFSFLKSKDAEILLTYRKGSFPINSGVVLAKSSMQTASFFTHWREQTESVLETPELYAQANNKMLPYGGADQMALHLMLGYSLKKQRYEYVLRNGEVVSVSMERCEDLNETLSVSITDQTRIIHYKGGWRSILFEHGPFTKNRPKKDSWEMFLLYHRTFQESITSLNERTNKNFSSADFGFHKPFYLEPGTLKERPGLYQIYALFWQIKNFFPRLYQYLKDCF